MKNSKPANRLPLIPDKRYFTIGEVSELCAVKPHVLRYWEQEFSLLRPSKRKGSRRYYQRRDILVIRKIRELLYDKGFTISGARQQLKFINLAEEEIIVKQDQQQHAVESQLPTPVTIPAVDVKPQAAHHGEQSAGLSAFLKQLVPIMRQDLELLLTELKA